MNETKDCNNGNRIHLLVRNVTKLDKFRLICLRIFDINQLRNTLLCCVVLCRPQEVTVKSSRSLERYGWMMVEEKTNEEKQLL